MSVIAHLIPRRAQSEDGFTLIEMLVATATGLIVVLALFTIMEIAVRQTSRISDTVQAETLGRSTLTRMVDELHSACIAHEFTPVQTGSTGSELRFRTGYGEGTVVEGGHAFEHRIEWAGGPAPASGKLIDKSYKSTGSWPNLVFETTTPTSSVTIGQNIYELPKPEPPVRAKKEYIPVFQYEKYAAKAAETETAGLSTLEPIELTEKKPSLTAEEAKSVAAVLVTFATAPSDNNQKLFRNAEFSDVVTFAFSAPASEATISDAPCQ